MDKLKYIAVLLLLAPTLFYGQKYSTRAGLVKFEASVQSYEEVAAENKTASAKLDAATGEIAVLVPMKAFRFKVALMEEHFNESYAETGKYPKATFTGKIDGFDAGKLTATPQAFTISGDLTIHGKTKKINDTAKISKSGDKIIVTGDFVIKPGDFDIEIPKVISKKIADTVSIAYSLSLNK
ncbi:YceI family protein [Flavobacterium sp. MFBS3-15]|uniref:YceI family protein n=1 Tax=Flavobacterium sp. MFBS3-15 TaxID=2989816 RepID=UPI00223560FA|nr:YceI family protein [Flavobacterium sp. MFBS3-15]MCW4469767.1 YceI family protein [Flavobacterium sp. MFBS3-15]